MKAVCGLFAFCTCLVVGGSSANVFPQTARNYRPIEGTKPRQLQLAGYEDAYCSRLNATLQVCRALVSEEEWETKFVVLYQGKVMASIESPAWRTIGPSPEDFAAFTVDLDRDGTAETVLASFEGVSNGMGVTYSTLYIFPDTKKNPDRQPISIPIQEFGYKDTLVYDKKLRQTLLLASYWDNSETLDKRRGWGMYLVGKWFRYSKGRLLPVFDRPTLARRFLFRFQSERDNGWFANRFPFRWLRDQTTHRIWHEPLSADKLVSSSSGTIQSYGTDKSGCKLTIKVTDGSVRSGKCAYGSGENESADDLMFIRSFGISQQRYLFPKDFDPANSLGDLTGKRVRIETYFDSFDRQYSIVWF